MTKEELRELKRTGRLKEMLGDAYDSEASFMRTNTTISAVTQDSDSDGEGGTGRNRKGGKSKHGDASKRRQSKAGKGLADAAGGKKKPKKGKPGDGGDEGDESELSGGGKKSKKKKDKGGEEEEDEDEEEDGGEGKRRRGEEGEEGDSDCSYRSEVSEGGTRRKVKVKRIRDADGNVIGYGDPEPLPDEFRGASVLGREGSITGASDDEHNASFKPGELGVLGEGEGEDALGPAGKIPAWKQRREQRRQSRLDAEGIAAATRGSGPDQQQQRTGPEGEDGSASAADRIPSAFSEATTASEDVDLSQMTEEERAAYLAARDVRRKEREERRRAKYGDRYDEIMKKKKLKKEQERKAKEDRQQAEREEKDRREEEKERQEKERLESEKEEAKRRRMSSSLKTSGSLLQKKDKPKSMVTYEKAAPRGLGGPIEKTDRRDIGPSHNDWTKNERRLSREDSSLSTYNKLPSTFQRMKTTDESGKGTRRRMPDRGELIDREKQRQIAEDAKKGLENGDLYEDDDLFELDEGGKLRLRKGKKVDLSKISDDMLRRLGIDPNLSRKEKAKLLKKLLGDDVTVLDGGRPVGFKALDEYDLEDMTDDQLADDPDLDLDTLSGQRRVNVLMRRGGLALREHMQTVMKQSRLMDDQAYRNDLDEKGGSVDFMTHYRLVNPDLLEGYARAFVVEDHDLDTVINLSESKTALEGIPTVNKMTPKQLDYVFRVRNFLLLPLSVCLSVSVSLFSLILSLSHLNFPLSPLSKHLLEMCNLADIERKLDLYMNMFYHNRRSDRDGNYIKADSLKIELIAGGLNWMQQQYIMEKMEVNNFGEISFLDYMCYIPLFLSMHDNIVDNPLDMSDQKYTLPPRTRPPSTQRDMNPLGYPLSRKSSLLMRKQARDLMEGKMNTGGLRPETRDRLQKYSRLPAIKPFRRSSVSSHTNTTSDLSSELTKTTDFFQGQ
ncbi:uncharacterized protein LOC143284853 [Babylonia areolata]|uniref:uncharacterized protein LOC143284853 n=1 Tax=Babylonia areolata TaxID=304850 RepID=UPI003FD098B3